MKSAIKRTLFLSAILMTLVFAGSSLVQAQHGYRVTKRIIFKKGQVSTLLRGTIPNMLEGHEYVFRARAGQTLKVSIKPLKSKISFFILTPSGAMSDEETALKNWIGELSESGDYHLIINTQTKGIARYTLEIQIATDI